MKEKGVEAAAAHLPLKLSLEDLGPTGLQAKVATKEGLAQAFLDLAKELRGIAEANTPLKKASRRYQSPWWSEEVREASKEAKQAERSYRLAPIAYNKDRLNQGLRALATAIKAGKTKT